MRERWPSPSGRDRPMSHGHHCRPLGLPGHMGALSFWIGAALPPLRLRPQPAPHSMDETSRTPLGLSTSEEGAAPAARGVPGPAPSHTGPGNSPFVRIQPCWRLRRTPQPLSHATLPENTTPRQLSLAGLGVAWQRSRCRPARLGRPGKLKDP